MKTCYYVILYRPQGSKTWTPLPWDEGLNYRGNFFAVKKEAIEWIKRIVQTGRSCYLVNPLKVVGTELFRLVFVSAECEAAIGATNVRKFSASPTAMQSRPNLTWLSTKRAWLKDWSIIHCFPQRY